MNGKSFHGQPFLYLALSLLVFTFIFLLLTNPKINALLGNLKNNKEVESEIKDKSFETEWHYEYGTLDVTEDYPSVHLRSGYKVIKKSGKNLLIGWKYRAVNTSKTGYTLKVDLSVTDKDGFKVGSGSASKYFKGERIRTLRGTFTVPIEEAERLADFEWTGRIDPPYKNEKKLKGNRFDKAGSILKHSWSKYRTGKWWLLKYLKFLFDDPEKFGKDKKDKWYRIAKAMDIKPDIELFELRKKLGLDDYSIPPFKEIEQSPEYESLTEAERKKVLRWLLLQKEFGEYDVVKGSQDKDRLDILIGELLNETSLKE